MELKPVFSVWELNTYVSLMLSGDENMQDVTVNGEISGFKRHISGHLYFTLKDDRAAVRCIMFKPNALRLTFFPKDGMQVQLHGSAGLYERDGSFQLNVRSMEKTGDGQLFARFMAYKQELEALGWLDPSIKKPIPKLPRCIGVVTSKTGAAIEDIRNVTARRFPSMPLILYPASVQGERAAKEIAAAIRKADAEHRCDVLIVGRGGGSMEDLWCFNEPEVAQAIHECSLPVISAVGHEIDFSIADFVADLRAPTPSAAAELAVPEQREMQARLEEALGRLRRALEAGCDRKRHRLEGLKGRPGILRLPMLLEQRRQELDMDREALLREQQQAALIKRHGLEAMKLRLEGVAPQRILERGYACVLDDKGKLVSSAKQVQPGQNVSIDWADGRASACITGKENTHGGQKL